MVFVLIGGGGATGAGGLAGMMGSAEHDHPEYATEADLERVQKSINERHDKTEEHLDETNKLLTDMRIALASFRPTRSPP